MVKSAVLFRAIDDVWVRCCLSSRIAVVVFNLKHGERYLLRSLNFVMIFYVYRLSFAVYMLVMLPGKFSTGEVYVMYDVYMYTPKLS